MPGADAMGWQRECRFLPQASHGYRFIRIIAGVMLQRSRLTRVRSFISTKKLLALRKEYPALRGGDFTALETGRGALAYLRSTRLGNPCWWRSISKAGWSSSRPPQGRWQLLFSSHADFAPISSRISLAPLRGAPACQGKLASIEQIDRPAWK